MRYSRLVYRNWHVTTTTRRSCCAVFHVPAVTGSHYSLTITDMELTKENEKRRLEFIADYAAKSKAPGDFYWQKAEALGACGDYVYGQDEGEAPQGANW